MWKKFKSWYNGLQHLKPVVDFPDQIVTLNGQNFSYRRAVETDVEGLLAVERACYAGTTPWDRFAFLAELRKFDKSLYVVLELDHQIQAFIGCWFTQDESHITNLAVLPKWQNLGIGRFLMASMIQIAQALPSWCVTLEVRVSNEPAKHLYHRLGFSDQGIKRAYYSANHEDALDMCLPLRQHQPVPKTASSLS